LKICLLSAPLHGTRQRKKVFFFEKILCRVPASPALDKAGKLVKIGFVFPALPSVFGIALGKGSLGKVTITDPFF
jgi:hypothetical protein